ncbi:MAG: hydrogenase small subunit [Betaproteobacteria bacterium]
MLTRREFLKLCAATAVTWTLTDLLFEELVKAATGPVKPKAIWLQASTCTGNTLSFANTVNPYLSRVLLDVVDLKYHPNLSGAMGDAAMRQIDEAIRKAPEYVVIIEGAIPTGLNGLFGTIGERSGKPVTMMQIVREVGERAKAVVAIGVCATHGGPFAAYPNPTGCIGVSRLLKRPVINCPGCPCHPDWFVGTLSSLLLYGEPPELDHLNRPRVFYGQTVHDLCTRRSYFENGLYARYPGDFGCMYKIGCKGPITYADCPRRKWNEYVNWPVEDNTPCIGCANPGFPDASSPFFVHLPSVKTPKLYVNANTLGVAAGAVTAAAIGAHAIGQAASGRGFGGSHKEDPNGKGHRGKDGEK